MPRPTPDEAAALAERFRRLLRDRRMPVTRQRLAVADEVFRAEDHPSIGELQRRLRARGEAIGTATLYRTLDLLVESGLARRHDFGQGFHRFEPAASAAAPPHEHFVCARCGRVEEFTNDRLERMLRMTADEQRFQYQAHRIEVHGLCAECRGRDFDPLAGGGAR
jgi:Fur family transcriptional regulator, ferric uptake regulator